MFTKIWLTFGHHLKPPYWFGFLKLTKYSSEKHYAIKPEKLISSGIKDGRYYSKRYYIVFIYPLYLNMAAEIRNWFYMFLIIISLMLNDYETLTETGRNISKYDQ